jgi:hypothetical protein
LAFLGTAVRVGAGSGAVAQATTVAPIPRTSVSSAADLDGHSRTATAVRQLQQGPDLHTQAKRTVSRHITGILAGAKAGI